MRLLEDDAADSGDDFLSMFAQRLRNRRKAERPYLLITQTQGKTPIVIEDALSAEAAAAQISGMVSLMVLQDWQIIAQTRFSALLSLSANGVCIVEFSVEVQSRAMVDAIDGLYLEQTTPLHGLDDSADSAADAQ